MALALSKKVQKIEFEILFLQNIEKPRALHLKSWFAYFYTLLSLVKKDLKSTFLDSVKNRYLFNIIFCDVIHICFQCLFLLFHKSWNQRTFGRFAFAWNWMGACCWIQDFNLYGILSFILLAATIIFNFAQRDFPTNDFIYFNIFFASSTSKLKGKEN